MTDRNLKEIDQCRFRVNVYTKKCTEEIKTNVSFCTIPIKLLEFKSSRGRLRWSEI